MSDLTLYRLAVLCWLGSIAFTVIFVSRVAQIDGDGSVTVRAWSIPVIAFFLFFISSNMPVAPSDKEDTE